MASLRVFFSRLLGLLRRNSNDRQLREEIDSHLEMLAEDFRRQGMSAAAAREAALREFGGVTQVREEYRSSAGLRWVETLGQDVRYALRLFRRNPGFTAVVVLLLGLGIGVNTAIFSGVNAVLLRLLPVNDPGSLVSLNWAARGFPGAFLNDLDGRSRRGPGAGMEINFSFSYPAYKDFRDHSPVFLQTMAVASNHDQVNAGLNGHAENARMQSVSGNFFEGLEVRPAAGRLLSPVDDDDSAPPVAVVSYSFWKQKLGGELSAIGKPITVNGSALTVVGVTPREFFGLEPGYTPDIWTPLNLYARDAARHGNLNNDLPLLRDDKTWWLEIIGRLRPGVSMAQAQARLASQFQNNLRATVGPSVPQAEFPVFGLSSMRQGIDSARSRVSLPLLLLMGMVGLVLLIACANVAGLMLARSTARRREIAIRLSLGSARLRLIRQLLTESVLLALMGGAAGLLFALWALSFLRKLVFAGQPAAGLEFHLDLPVLAFTAAISILSGILFGLAPALRATRRDVMDSLKQNAASGSHRFLSGRLLASAQVAICLLLMMAAGLFVRTLQKLEAVEVGFDRQNLVVFTVRPGLNGYKDTRLAGYYQELQRRLQLVPGVQSVAFSQRGPIGAGMHTTVGTIPGFTPAGAQTHMYAHTVGPDYFKVFGIPVLRGRAIGPQDGQGAPRVIVINHKLARDVFHGQDPIGHRINFGSAQKPREYEIVGTVADVKYNKLREDPPPTVYFSYLQRPSISNFMTFEVRGSGDPQALMSAIQAQSLALDKDIPVVNLRTEAAIISETLLLERVFAMLSTAFGFLAILLACVGLYGTMAYAVAQRTSEIGIRMALGAERGAILKMVLRETMKVVGWGVAAGLPLAWIATRLLRSQLFQLAPHDPETMAFVLAAIFLVTGLAGFLPARRASRVDPMVALRCE